MTVIIVAHPIEGNRQKEQTHRTRLAAKYYSFGQKRRGGVRTQNVHIKTYTQAAKCTPTHSNCT